MASGAQQAHSEGVTTLGHAAHSGFTDGTTARPRDVGSLVSASDLACPICLQRLHDAFVTSCGHTFCYSCIGTHLKHRRNCPCCASYLTTEHIYPNFLLNKILSKAAGSNSTPQTSSLLRSLEKVLEERKASIRQKDLDAAIQLLQEHREQLAEQEETTSLQLLLLMLQDARQSKHAARAQLGKQLQGLERDLAAVARALTPASPGGVGSRGGTPPPPPSPAPAPAAMASLQPTPSPAGPSGTGTEHPAGNGLGPAAAENGVVPSAPAAPPALGVARPASAAFGPDASQPDAKRLAGLRTAKKRLMLSQYDDLQDWYHQLGQSGAVGLAVQGAQQATAAEHPAAGEPSAGPSDRSAWSDRMPALQRFGEVLNAATTFTRLSVAAEVPRVAVGGPAAAGGRNGALRGGGAASVPPSRAASAHLVSCIDFDAAARLLATCSSQRLFLWDYAALKTRAPEQQGAVGQLPAVSKLTGLAFSRLQQELLAATSTEGRVHLFDTTRQEAVADIAAHDGRIWAIDFAPAAAGHGDANGAGPHAHCFASGSDDYTLRVWDVRAGTAACTVDSRANVCSVRWCTWDSNYVAVGSAAHAVLLYDLRRAGGTAPPLATLAGHAKAVSYVRWASRTELMSASTDSTLRLWNLADWVDGGARSAGHPLLEAGTLSGGLFGGPCVRKYTGHMNERNFVGLSVADDLIATGSEAHEVVLYHKHMPHPAMRYKLGELGGAEGAAGNGTRGLPAAPGHFTSALLWHPTERSLVVASSQGSLWVLALQQDALL